VDLWCAFHDQVIDEQLIAAYRQLLSDPERAQEVRFYFARDRHRYLVTRALVRSVLARYFEIAPEAWRFTTNNYGRPEIVDELVRSSGLTFNLSHSSQLIVLAVAHQRQLGVDTEDFRSRSASIDVAERFFSPAEVAALRKQSWDTQQQRFFEYWTLKESYIKARGMGLSIPLDKFGFVLEEPGAVDLEIDPELQDSPTRWQFWQLEVKDAYLIAVCAERIAQPTQLAMTEVIPLVSQRPLPFRSLRQ
jgi:4'-phosphopantetheinyl transferase